MANLNAPYGLRPSRKLGGGCVVQNAYSIADGYNTNIFTGDIVELTGTGTDIQIAAAGGAGDTQAVGVFAGCNFIDAEGNVKFKPYWPANTAIAPNTKVEALVFDDPDIIFRGMADSIAEANVGALADWVVGSGSVVTGKSTSTVEGSATATTAKSLKILRLLPEVGNEYGNYGQVEVLFAEHALKGIITGAGGS